MYDDESKSPHFDRIICEQSIYIPNVGRKKNSKHKIIDIPSINWIMNNRKSIFFAPLITLRFQCFSLDQWKPILLCIVLFCFVDWSKHWRHLCSSKKDWYNDRSKIIFTDIAHTITCPWKLLIFWVISVVKLFNYYQYSSFFVNEMQQNALS